MGDDGVGALDDFLAKKQECLGIDLGKVLVLRTSCPDFAIKDGEELEIVELRVLPSEVDIVRLSSRTYTGMDGVFSVAGVVGVGILFKDAPHLDGISASGSFDSRR